jgi:hypothetical protein
MRGLHHFKIRGKLTPRFIELFKIMKKRGKVAYQLELPPQLSEAQYVPCLSTKEMFACA